MKNWCWREGKRNEHFRRALQRQHPALRKIHKKGSKYHETAKELCDLEAVFYTELSEKGREAYNGFLGKRIWLQGEEDCDNFIAGYRLGVKLLLAVLMDYNTPLPQITDR